MHQPLVNLEPFTEADIDQLIAWIPSPEFLAQWTGLVFDYPLDRAQVMPHLIVRPHLTVRPHLNEANRETPSSLVYKAVAPQTGATIGHGELGRIDRKNLSAALMRILVGPPELRGSGIGEGIVRALLRIAFNDLYLHRVELNVFEFNQSAIRCYEKVGFRLEGVQREACKVGDTYWNMCAMSILEQEYHE